MIGSHLGQAISTIKMNRIVKIKRNKVYLFFILIAFCYCKDDEIQKKTSECVPNEAIISKDSTFEIYSPGKQEYGYANAIKLNKPWKASSTAFISRDTFKIFFRTYWDVPNDPDWEYDTEFLIIKIPNLNEKCMKLSRTATNNSCEMHYSALLDDATEDDYYILESDLNNYIQFDTFNLETGRVAGKFMVSFERDKSRVKKPWNPDFVRFFNGEFHCRIKN